MKYNSIKFYIKKKIYNFSNDCLKIIKLLLRWLNSLVIFCKNNYK